MRFVLPVALAVALMAGSTAVLRANALANTAPDDLNAGLGKEG
jgi:hypothetical protein